MKLYGFAYATRFSCLCFGKKAWHFKLIWSSAYNRFYWYSWWSDTKTVWWERVNSYPFKFFGFMVLPHEDIYDLD